MSIELLLLAILAATIIYLLVSRRLDQTIITLPMVFTALGFAVVGPVEQLAEADKLHEVARTVAEITLILVLFADASHVRFASLRKNFAIPARMLVVGMPLTILFGTIILLVLPPEQGWAVALLTAAILTPTDAALGQAVVSAKSVPNHLSQSINVESGLNDGLALPVILFAAIMAGTAAHGDAQGESIFVVAMLQLLLGPIAGALVGFVIARALGFAQQRGLVSMTSQGIVFVCSAFTAFLLAEEIGGNGFIAAFVAGAVFGNVFKADITFISEFMEGQGQLLTMLAFFVFGSVLLPAAVDHMSWVPLLVGVLFMTIVRMLPIWLALAGTGLRLREKLFLGWFGPRGLASILFSLIIVDEYEIPHEGELLACVVMTVFLSIVLHGVSAAALARKIGES